jgi:hypothetical protein
VQENIFFFFSFLGILRVETFIFVKSSIFSDSRLTKIK